MLPLLQGSPSLAAAYLPAADPSIRLQDKQAANRMHAATPKGEYAPDSAEDSLNTAANEAPLGTDALLGLPSTLTAEHATAQYKLIARLGDTMSAEVPAKGNVELYT